mmetsp:Transcript_35626/g.113933  ORF Transcript_35626/g.113933 Transcript_35626/m.113933 type:complete len:573 (+) Transcript_35626:159-1877(+)
MEGWNHRSCDGLSGCFVRRLLWRSRLVVVSLFRDEGEGLFGLSEGEERGGESCRGDGGDGGAGDFSEGVFLGGGGEAGGGLEDGLSDVLGDAGDVLGGLGGELLGLLVGEARRRRRRRRVLVGLGGGGPLGEKIGGRLGAEGRGPPEGVDEELGGVAGVGEEEGDLLRLVGVDERAEGGHDGAAEVREAVGGRRRGGRDGLGEFAVVEVLEVQPEGGAAPRDVRRRRVGRRPRRERVVQGPQGFRGRRLPLLRLPRGRPLDGRAAEDGVPLVQGVGDARAEDADLGVGLGDGDGGGLQLVLQVLDLAPGVGPQSRRVVDGRQRLPGVGHRPDAAVDLPALDLDLRRALLDVLDEHHLDRHEARLGLDGPLDRRLDRRLLRPLGHVLQLHQQPLLPVDVRPLHLQRPLELAQQAPDAQRPLALRHQLAVQLRTQRRQLLRHDRLHLPPSRLRPLQQRLQPRHLQSTVRPLREVREHLLAQLHRLLHHQRLCCGRILHDRLTFLAFDDDDGGLLRSDDGRFDIGLRSRHQRLLGGLHRNGLEDLVFDRGFFGHRFHLGQRSLDDNIFDDVLDDV